jgi:2-polyprenyl-3-methyl-5-hydroxy-6-metoxy-1,4-benzoquinol methylase
LAGLDYNHTELGSASPFLLPVLSGLLAGLPRGAVVADLGCGNGSILARFADRGWELHGLDVSASGVAQASTAFPSIRFERADLSANILTHPLAGKCDAVISTEVVEHILLPRIYVRNCHALLKPGGLLAISTPYHGYLKNVAIALAGGMDFHFNALWDYGHVKFWSRRTLSALLDECGFTIREFHGVGRVPYLWRSMIVSAVKR